MRKHVVVLALALCLVGLAGCNKDSQTLDQVDIKENTTMINADGTMQSAIVESFEKDYYKEDGLKSYIDENIQSYTDEAGKDAVTLDSLEVEDKIATAQFTYKTVADYAKFNAVEAEMLTKEAALQDERLSDTIYSVEKGDTVALKDALTEDDYKIFLISLPEENIMTDGEVAYYANGTLVDSKQVKTGSDGYTIIIYK